MTLIKRVSRSAFFWFCLWLMWMGLIFYFSHLPGSPWPPNISWAYFLERKGAHVFEYAVLTLLSLQVFSLWFPKEKLTTISLLAGVFAISYGVTDELHQFFIPYRGAHFRDVTFDVIGVLLILLPILFFIRKKRKKKLPR